MIENKEYSELKRWLEDTADERCEDMGAFFDRRISGYEDHMSPWTEHYVRVAELLPQSTQTLLDLGCGTGLELDRIFERMPDLRVTAIDLSESMTAQLIKKHGSRNLEVILDDYFLYDLGENRFDAAVSVESFHHFTAEKKAGLFAKIYRALKPGGIYIECDYIASIPEIEELTFKECRRRRERDGIPDDRYIHFDTPLTLEHELSAMRSGGFDEAALVEQINGTPIIVAKKRGV